jgi:hypothetical protein
MQQKLTSSLLVLMSKSSNLPATWPGSSTEQINVDSTGLQQIVMILQRKTAHSFDNNVEPKRDINNLFRT